MNPESFPTAPHPMSHPYEAPQFALSAAEYRILVEKSPMMIWRSGVDALCDYFNETWLAFTGRTMEQEIGDGWARGVHPDDLKDCIERYLDAFHNRESFELEYRLRRHDGVYRWISDRGTPLFDPTSTFIGYIGSCVDIDERRQAQVERDEHRRETLGLYRELSVREARIHRLIDANVVGVVCADTDGRVVEANDAFLSMLGYTRDDVNAGRLHRNHLTPGEWKGATERAISEMRERGTSSAFEKEYFRKDGTRIPVLVGAASYGDERRELVAFVLDLTEAKRAEKERERLQHAEADLAYMNRVLTAGELAASIAHDVKRPITAALATAETCTRLLQRDSPDLETIRDVLAEISTEIRQASEIVDRVRSLYMREAPRHDAVELNELIRDTIVLLRREATKSSVSIQTDLEPGLPAVVGDRVQLQQVVMNLVLNGVEAMKDHPGELLVITQRGPDGEVLVSVADRGIGLPVKDADRIFDAFFTTKPQGTGMGLAISRAIVQAHGGSLWATANQTAGATFQFTLPGLLPHLAKLPRANQGREIQVTDDRHITQTEGSSSLERASTG